MFNRIKETYSSKIDELNELKRQVFLMTQSASTNEPGAYILDHHARSKLRILIESLLIDLNEEIFALSEELARSFASFDMRSQLPGGSPLQRALEFDQRKNQLMRKIKESIDDNHSVKIIRRHAKIATIQSESPPQRDMNTFGNEEQPIGRSRDYNT